MIDRQARNQFVTLLHNVLAHGTTLTDLERSLHAGIIMSDDAGIQAVYSFIEELCDGIAYSTPFPSTNTAQRAELSPDIQCRLQLSLTFLSSDCEYEWPPMTFSGTWTDSLLLLLCGLSIGIGLLNLAISAVVRSMLIVVCGSFAGGAVNFG